MPLDMFTMSAVDITVTTVLGLVLVFAWLKQPSARLVGWWGLSMSLQAAGLVAVAASALANAPTAITAGLAVMLVSDSLKWTAARGFVHRPTPAAWALAAPIVLLFPSFSGLLADLADRFVLFSLLTALVNLGAAFELARAKGERLISHWPAVVMLAATAVAVLLVVPLALSGKVPFDNPSEAYLGGWFATTSFVMVTTRIALAFIVLNMAKQRQEMEQRVHALTDTLTGLPNRRAFYERLDALERKRIFKGAPISVLFFDLDHFKEINDTFGHETGDCVLEVFAATAGARLKEKDMIARMGGEEFAALLPGVDADEAVSVAEDVRQAFAEAATRCGDRELGATVSVGIAASAASAWDASDISALLREADAALYEAKRAGRNRVEVLHPETASTRPVDQKFVRPAPRRQEEPARAPRDRSLVDA